MKIYYIYKFLDENNEIIYVGKTRDINSRMSTHFGSNGHLTAECYNNVKKIMYFTCNSGADMDILERYYINKIKPKYNTVDTNLNLSFDFNLDHNPKWVEYDLNIKYNIDKKETNHKVQEIYRYVSIKELSDEIGITVQAIYKRLNNMNSKFKKEHIKYINNKQMLDETIVKEIKSINIDSENIIEIENIKDNTNYEKLYIESLKSQIENLEKDKEFWVNKTNFWQEYYDNERKNFLEQTRINDNLLNTIKYKDEEILKLSKKRSLFQKIFA